MTSKVEYLGDLRTQSIHIASGSMILSDAPKDNQGKGEAFSPTDTVANALASCMMTIMGIKAKDLDINLIGSIASVEKIMGTEPRRITTINIHFAMPATVTEKQKIILEKAALTCPVFYSLHPEIKKEITFSWSFELPFLNKSNSCCS